MNAQPQESFQLKVPFNLSLMQNEVQGISSGKRLDSSFNWTPIRRMQETKTTASKGVLSLASVDAETKKIGSNDETSKE